MPDQTPPPALLSLEQLDTMAQWHKRLLANYETKATDETIRAAGLTGIGVSLDDITSLLADAITLRAQVAQQLRALLEWPDPAQLHTDKWYSAAADYERRIHAVANVLNLAL